MRVSQLQIHFLHWTAFVWWCIMEGGMPLWCHVPRLVKNRTTTHRYQSSLTISQRSFLYVIWTRGSRVPKIDGPILWARARFRNSTKTVCASKCFVLVWAVKVYHRAPKRLKSVIVVPHTNFCGRYCASKFSRKIDMSMTFFRVKYGIVPKNREK